MSSHDSNCQLIARCVAASPYLQRLCVEAWERYITVTRPKENAQDTVRRHARMAVKSQN